MANPPRRPTRPGRAKQPLATPAFTEQEAVLILTSPDFHHERVERVHELLDEARRLRVEQKQAIRAKQKALRAWDTNRNADTSAAFDEACERCDTLQEHIATIIKDLGLYRDISSDMLYPHRRAAHPKPEPQG